MVGKERDMLGKGLHLLTKVGEHAEGVGVTQLAQETGLPISTTHRLMSTLVSEGYVAIHPTTRLYRVALRVFELSHKAADTWGSARVREVMSALANESGESILMGAIDGTEFVYLEHVEGPKSVRVKGNLGSRGPLHCTALGKLLLAMQPEGQRDQIIDQLELVQYTPRTITSKEQLRAELTATQQRGFSVTNEEYEPEISSIAVPVSAGGRQGSTIAICIAAPLYRASIDQLREWLPRLRDVGRQIALYHPGGQW